MKNTLYILVILMMSIATACTPNDNTDFPGNKPPASYEVKNDNPVPMSSFLAMLPDEYADLKKPMADVFSMLESEIAQKIGKPDIKIGFRKIIFLYPSTDVNGDPITLSAVAYWLGYFENNVWNDIKPDNICLMEHYTITSDAEAPSNTFPLEMFMTRNTLTILPDYIGYGTTKEIPHPYLNHDVCAINSIDALTAGYSLFNDKNKCGMSQGWKLYLAGASQGAGNAVAVHKYLDTHLELARKWNFAATNCSSGPYSPVVTIDKYLAEGKVAYPVVFPLVIKTMFDSYPAIMKGFTEDMAYSEGYLAVKSEIDRMLASKEYNTSAINQVFIDKVRKTVDATLADNEIYLTDILSPAMLDKESPINKALYMCLEKNDLTKGWTPTHPMKLHYSLQDKVVPHENSQALFDAFGEDIVTLEQSQLPTDHTTTCSMWMINLLSKGF
ncbi:MAG: hypothetical protein IKY19_05055 [Bacteroidaceae bacterium]|nr:hypothetical protein [Bacteroidaceae bacterium]